MIEKIIAAALGFISAVESYHWFNKYMFAVFAVIVSICLGLFVYIAVLAVINEFRGGNRRL